MSAPQHCYLRMHHDSIFHCCGPGLRFKKLPKQIGLDFHVQYLLTESYIGFFVNCSLFNDKYSSYFHMTFYLRKCHFLIFFWLTNKFELVSRPLTVGIYLSVAMNYQELWIKCSVEQFSFLLRKLQTSWWAIMCQYQFIWKRSLNMTCCLSACSLSLPAAVPLEWW